VVLVEGSIAGLRYRRPEIIWHLLSVLVNKEISLNPNRYPGEMAHVRRLVHQLRVFRSQAYLNVLGDTLESSAVDEIGRESR
jgi:hypothetical protein